MTWITIESWYYTIAMIVLSVCSIRAYRKTLNKIFILFLIICIPTVADKLYTNINLYLLKNHMTSIPHMLTGKYRNERSPKSPGIIQMEKEKSELWTEYFKKQKEVEKKYEDSISQRKKYTWLKDLWNNIVWRLSSVLFPIVGIIICLQELKKFQPAHGLYGENAGRVGRGL